MTLLRKLKVFAVGTGLAMAAAAGADGPTQLTVGDVLKSVDRNFPKLIGERLQREVADAKVREKRGAFDPVFSVTSDSARYNSSSTRGKALEFFTHEAAAEILLPSGAKVSAGVRLNSGTVKSPLSSTGSIGEYFLSLKLPLMRGRLINEKRTSLRQAEVSRKLSDLGIESLRLELFQKASETYWDWQASGQKLKIARDLLKVASTRADLVATSFNHGDATKQQLEEARQEVERRQGLVFKAERDFAKSSFKLNLLLWPESDTSGNPPGDPPGESQLPSVLAPSQEFDEGSVPKLFSRAESRRPELDALGVYRTLYDLDYKLAKNDRMPRLDFTVGPGVDLGDQSIGSTWKVGVAYSVPLAQNTVDGQLNAIALKQQKLGQDMLYVRQQIRNEVTDAVNAIGQAYRRFQAAQREYALAKEVERIELVSFREGGSTLFLVNQRERATAEALQRTVEIYAEYQQALVALRAATTDILAEVK